MRQFVLLSALLLGAAYPPARAQTPYVTGTLPWAHAPAAPLASPLLLLYSQPVEPTTAGQLRVYSGQSGGRLAGAATAAGNQVSFSPLFEFRPGETVQFTSPAQVLSSGGAASRPYVGRFTVQAQPGSARFAGGSDVPVGTNPGWLDAADVDADGDLDLLVSNITDNTVSVRLNDGLGNFGGGSTVPVGNGPFCVRAADVDGDGDLDMLLAEYDTDGLSVLRNDGTGRFSGRTRYGVGQYPRELAVADFDGDGDLDAATANAGVTRSVSVRFNDGAGNFDARNYGVEVPVGRRVCSVAAADVDGDGDMDLLAANWDDNTVSVRLNDGQGNFQSGTEVPVNTMPFGLATADVDGDGDVDFLVASQGTNTVCVRLNNGQGVFSGGSNPAVTPFAISINTADVDGDGDVDLLTSGGFQHNTVSVLLNNGQGQFTLQTPDIVVGNSPNSLMAADVDGDGDLDLLTECVNPAGTVCVRLNPSQLTRPSLAPTSGATGATVLLTGADFTGTSAVSFNGAPAPAGSFVVVSSTSLRVTVPARARTGRVRVTTPREVLYSDQSFQVTSVTAATSRRLLPDGAIYPNPAREYALVQVPPGTGPATLRLYDELGAVVRTITVAQSAAPTPVTLDLQSLRPGLYLVRLQTPDRTGSTRLLIN